MGRAWKSAECAVRVTKEAVLEGADAWDRRGWAAKISYFRRLGLMDALLNVGMLVHNAVFQSGRPPGIAGNCGVEDNVNRQIQNPNGLCGMDQTILLSG